MPIDRSLPAKVTIRFPSRRSITLTTPRTGEYNGEIGERGEDTEDELAGVRRRVDRRALAG
jgi:hypothetical protein